MFLNVFVDFLDFIHLSLFHGEKKSEQKKIVTYHLSFTLLPFLFFFQQTKRAIVGKTFNIAINNHIIPKK
jgi:hypothetical protein